MSLSQLVSYRSSLTRLAFYSLKLSLALRLTLNLKPHTHDQDFLDELFLGKFNLLVCTPKINKFSLTSRLFQNWHDQFLSKALCQGKILKENLVVFTELNTCTDTGVHSDVVTNIGTYST